MNYKYMRIQGREDSYITKYPKGIFSLCWNLVNEGVMEQSENDLFINIDEWFKCNLPEPEPCVNREKVITFFKCDSAKEMYEKLKPAMELLIGRMMLSARISLGQLFMKMSGKLWSK